MSEQNQNNEIKNQIFKDEEALLLNHDYDGIQELDHPLPFWWLAIFWLTIAFSAVYVGYYMTGVGPTLNEELVAELKEIEAKKPQQPANAGGSDEAILASLNDPTKLANGKEVYIGKCAACHGQAGEGLIGPNLADDAWIHGDGTLAGIQNIISVGVAEKGMPPWNSVLTPDELVNVTAFVRSLHGTNPPNAKEAQGSPMEFKNL